MPDDVPTTVAQRADVEVPRGPGLRTNRLEAFSDGVFAIAITLLVLELDVPAASGNLIGGILDEWPSLLAYFVSFATIGAVWLAHNAVTDHLERVDSTFLRLNLLLLLVVSFIPFPTRLLAERISDQEAERIATTIYGVVFLLASVLIAVLWRYALRAGLEQADFSDEEVQRLTQRLTPGLIGYVVIIAIGLLFPVAAIVGYAVIAGFFLIPLPHRNRAEGPDRTS